MKESDRATPVSYTHLDVYKRQELQRGKKLHDGDVFSYDGETVKVVK